MSRSKVLVLDDDLLTGVTMQRIIASGGYEARTATDAVRFFLFNEEWKPDVIVLDLVMPDMDGMQILAELASRSCDSAIIITSGVGKNLLDSAKHSALEQGLNVIGILAKPFNAATLKNMLDAALLLQTPQAAVAGTVVHDGRGSHAALTPQDLETAFAHNELFNVYQPKVDCHSLALTGVEVLVRWRHPELGLVGPDFFIAMAEKAGLIEQLTLELLERALRWFAGLRGENSLLRELQLDPAHLGISVNIPAHMIGNESIFERFSAMCDEWGVPHHQLIFELNESGAMKNAVSAHSLLTRLRMKGFRLAIDDFGTGFSSMLQLVRLPLSEIKVDKSFVLTAMNSDESRAVIRSSIVLAHSLGLQVTAEGVEDEATLEFLRSLGCDLIQGSQVALPLSEADMSAWLRLRHPLNK